MQCIVSSWFLAPQVREAGVIFVIFEAPNNGKLFWINLDDVSAGNRKSQKDHV